MGISIKHTILFLMVISSVFIYLPQAKGGCAGGCAVSGVGGSSTSFMGDQAGNIDMSGFDEFVRDSVVSPVINSLENMTSHIKTVKLGASGMQDTRLSTLVFAAFNNMF
jgi:hypothetical protein